MADQGSKTERLEVLRATFFDECAEQLTEVEALLTSVGQEPGGLDAEALNQMFRSVHSIKGNAGAFDFDRIVEVSHALEAYLEGIRSAEVEVSDRTVATLVDGRDLLADIVERTKTGQPIEEDACASFMSQVNAVSSIHASGTSEGDADEVEEGVDVGGEPEASVMQVYTIKFKPTARLFETGNDPLIIVRELRLLGDVTVTASLDLLPSLSALNPVESYLVWTFTLVTNASREDVEEIFEFVADVCALRIETGEAAGSKSPVRRPAGGLKKPPMQPPPVKASAAAVPPETIDVEEVPVQRAPSAQAATAVTDPAASAPAPAAQLPQKITSVRVDLDRIDTLVNMVGELVITQAMLEQYVEAHGLSGGETFHRGIETMSSHMRDLQEGVMAVRMQPVRTVFARMPRLVRELSRKLNKRVKLTLKGQDTEVDKTIIELLSDPLTHMIRNSLDHGIELPQDRVAAGKPEEAEIVLAADQRSGRILIEISDDGAGINRERVLAKAVENGLVQSGVELLPEEIDDLIFAPGFSTAAEVTDVSGRGVGMDVVRRSIQELGGRVTVISDPGRGARFVMALPLTLAVMDGMIVRVGSERYILPLACIVESLQAADGAIQTVMDQGRYIHHRGEYVPLISLADVFSAGHGDTQSGNELIVFVETGMGKTLGLRVDALLGQRQVVIKSLEENFLRIEGVSAATILGDGRVALILDVESIEEMIEPIGHKRTAAASLAAENTQEIAP